MASALPHPLNLPEILGIIFPFLDSNSLVACAQVSSLWADQATQTLWQEPPTSALESLIPFGRAQLYANKITRLRLGPSGIKPYQACRHLLFPRLKEISCAIDTTCTQSLLRCLQPSLKRCEMRLWSRENGDKNDFKYHESVHALFVQLSTRCSHIEDIYLDFFDLRWNGLLKFFEATPSLRSIKLFGSQIITDEVIQHLAARTNLTRLYTEFFTIREAVAQVEASTASPFAELEIFNGPVEENTILRFTRHMQKLESLSIVLHDYSANLLSAISHLSALRLLVVSFTAPNIAAIKAQDLISLAEGCQRLREISIYGAPCGRSLWTLGPGLDPDGSSIKDVDICRFSSFLPDLERLELQCLGELTVHSLKYLGRNCQRLRTCQLRGCIFDVSEFQRYAPSDTTVTRNGDSSGLNQSAETDLRAYSAVMHHSLDPLLIKSERTGRSWPLFPKLEFLRIDKFINSLDTNITMAISSLLSEAPKLEDFRALSRDGFTCEVIAETFRQLRGRNVPPWRLTGW